MKKTENYTNSYSTPIKLTEEEIRETYCANCTNHERCQKEGVDVTKCILSTF